MGLPSRARVDAGFEFVAALRTIERRWPTYRDPEFWRRLNPHLTVSDRPLARVTGTPPALTPTVVDRALAQFDRSGYLLAPSVIADDRLAPMRQAIHTLAAEGIPTGFACVYDEYYQVFDGLEPLFAPMLGDGYRWVAHGFWAFRVPPGDRAMSGLTAPSEPHRDSLGPDPRVLAGLPPSIVTLWVALTDVTPVDSCLYVVPKYADKGFLTGERDVLPRHFDMQDIRAVPAPAGSVLAWSTHLAHWGSTSSPDATGPRLSVTMYFQRADVPPFDASLFDPAGPVTLDQRLRWILQAFGAHDLSARLDWGPRVA